MISSDVFVSRINKWIHQQQSRKNHTWATIKKSSELATTEGKEINNNMQAVAALSLLLCSI